MTRRLLVREGIRYRVLLGHWLPRLLGHDAVTLGRTIRVAESVLTADLHCHEFQHIRQRETIGSPRFELTYLWQLIRHGYRGNAFEIEAYDRQAKPLLVATFADLSA